MATDLGLAVFGTTGIHPIQVPAEFSHPASIAKPAAGTESPRASSPGTVNPPEQVPTAWRTGRDHVRSEGLRESRRICRRACG
jgi:hypothetical protein